MWGFTGRRSATPKRRKTHKPDLPGTSPPPGQPGLYPEFRLAARGDSNRAQKWYGCPMINRSTPAATAPKHAARAPFPGRALSAALQP